VKNQHEKIKGYRDLTQEEIDLMNEIKAVAESVYSVVHKLEHIEGIPCDAPDGTTAPNFRWLSEGKMDIQKGFMSLVRSVAKPTTF
jgi:hypothetical protein